LPRPMIGRQDADFSLSGLKTALRLEAEKIAPLTDQDVADLCASFQRAVVETVIDRLRHGLRMFRERFGPPSALVASGGVAANGAIRAALRDLASEDKVLLVVPPPSLCTDNAAMIAWAGAERLAYGLCDTLDTAPRARWPLAQVGKPKDAAMQGPESGVPEQNPKTETAEAAPLLPPFLLARQGQGGGQTTAAEVDTVPAEPPAAPDQPPTPNAKPSAAA
jgi:N6-L-threonylcarbamoyladenine synthase